MAVEIFTTPIIVKYKSAIISKATFFVFVLTIIGIVLPYILAYYSGGLWLKHETFIGQPQVKLKGSYVLILTYQNFSRSVVCIHDYRNEYIKFLDECSFVEMYERDHNFDGLIDEIGLSFMLESENKIQLKSIYILSPIDYKMKHDICTVETEAMVVFQDNVVDFASELTVMSDLKFVQSKPIDCKHLEEFDNKLLLNRKFELDEIIKNYFDRSVSIHLKNTLISYKLQKRKRLHCKLILKIPTQKTIFVLRFWQVIKNAWIQYLAISVILSYILEKLKGLLFRKKLVVFYTEKCDK